MRTPEVKEKVMAEREKGNVHLEFCRQLYMEQLRNGRYFFTSILSRRHRGRWSQW